MVDTLATVLPDLQGEITDIMSILGPFLAAGVLLALIAWAIAFAIGEGYALIVQVFGN